MRFLFLLVSINSLDLYDFLELVSSLSDDCTFGDFFGLLDLLRFLFISVEDEEEVL